MNTSSCNRRYFLQMTVAALTLGDLISLSADPTPAPSTSPNTMDLGLATDFSKDQVYSNFYDKGWFLIRKDGKYFALTDVCPHKGGPLLLQPDNTFACKWHHAHFDTDGHVTKKPAKTDLVVYAVNVDANGHLIVTLPATVPLPPKDIKRMHDSKEAPAATPTPAT